MLVSGRHDGRRVIVDVTIVAASKVTDGEGAPRFGIELLTALLDTGATSTSVAPEAARRLSLKAAGKRDVHTANGWRRAWVYEFSVGLLQNAAGGASVPYILPRPVSGFELPLEGSRFDILLGMDVISQGDLAIRRDGTWSFEF